MHNLYFPWIRIIIFSILFSIPFFTRDFFKIEISIPFPFPSKSYFPVENLSVKESDLQEYEIASKERSSNIEYTINGSEKQYAGRIVIGMRIWIFMTVFLRRFVANMIRSR